MNKVISAELKKMVSKPGIYILSILLAVILVLGVFIYKPVAYNKDKSITLSGNTVIEKYQDFVGNGTSSGIKSLYFNEVQANSNAVASYLVSGKTVKENIDDLKTEFNNNFKAYRECPSLIDVSDTTIENTRLKLVASFEALNAAITTGINAASKGSYQILTTNNNHTTYTSNYDEALKLLKTKVSKEKITEICNDYINMCQSNIEGSINAFVFPVLTEQVVKNYTSTEENSRYTIELQRLKEIEDKITNIYNETQADPENKNHNPEIIKELETLANRYAFTAKTYCNLVKYELLSNAFSFVSTKNQLDLMFLANESKYNSNTLLIRYTYLFENNKTEEDYAHPLTIGVNSNQETNAYDYSYFILKLFSFIIIVYAIMSMCHAISGEIKEGSMRYLAIRPVSRGNLIMGKFLAVMIMSVIMIMFSGIISILVGGAVYGFGSQTILTIFNGTTALTMHPICMIAIFLLSLIIEVSIYTALSALIATLLKSDLLAVTILMLFYLINLILPMVVPGGVNSPLTYYLFSHISFYSLFGSSIYASSTGFLNMLLGVKVFISSNIWLTVGVSVTILLLSLIATFQLFKRKEL